MKYTRSIIENLFKNKITHQFIFTLKRCESCDLVKAEIDRRNIDIEFVDYQENQELAKDFNFSSFPVLVKIENGSYKYYQGYVNILDKVIKNLKDDELQTEFTKA